MKRIISIQDISCLGKCSLTVALPILSAMGVECAIVPTAVLSTHSRFPGFTFRDLTEDLGPIADHWQQQGFRFDAIYTGYLGSRAQIRLVGEYIDRFGGGDTLIFMDPVMGDHGRLYAGFDEDFVGEMAGLCARAHVIVPNLTEACLLTGTAYRQDPEEAWVRELLHKLADLGAEKVVLTGVCLEAGKTGFVGMEAATGKLFTYAHEKIDASFSGTGDLFASTAVGALMGGRPLPQALTLAGDFVRACIHRTVENGGQDRYGVDFEEVIPWLIRTLQR